MYKILFFFLILFSNVTFGQPSTAKIVIVDGVEYYEHLVVSGNTLWGLQQMYGVKSDDLFKRNPSLVNGLKLDQKVLVPVIKKSSSVDGVKTSNYKVKKKETLYGLSKKFNVSIDYLMEQNPELKNGLRKGQLIKVPFYTEKQVETIDTLLIIGSEPIQNPFISDTIVNDSSEDILVTFSDTTIKHVVLAHETMYSISKRFMVSIETIMSLNGLKSTSLSEGQVLLIPVKNERVSIVDVKEVPLAGSNDWVDSIVFEKKEEYNIAIMLPLHLDFGSGYSKYVSNLAAQFYMGAKLAIDQLEEKGLKARVHIFDTKNDSTTIANLFNQLLFENVDLVIGPLLKTEVAQVAGLCGEKRIRMICPVKMDGEVLEDNPFVYSSVGSNLSLMRGLAIHISTKSSSDNVILVKPNDVKSVPYYEEFLSAYGEVATDHSPSIVMATQDNFNTMMRKRNKTLFVIPTVDKKSALKFMNSLNRSSFRSHPGNILVFGMKDWVNFTSINNMYKNKYKFHYASPNHLDYYSAEMIEVNGKYRNLYNTDISKMAVQGYDVVNYFCASFFLDIEDHTSLMNDFQMVQVGKGHGNENFKSFIISQEEFELLNVEE